MNQIYLILHYVRRFEDLEDYLAFDMLLVLRVLIPQVVRLHVEAVDSALVLHDGNLCLQVYVLLETLLLVSQTEG